MAATIEQLLVNNPNWSYAEIGVAYIAWDAAIKYAEVKFTSTNTRSNAIPPRYCKDCVAFTVCAEKSDVVQGGVECLEVARRYSIRA